MESPEEKLIKLLIKRAQKHGFNNSSKTEMINCVHCNKNILLKNLSQHNRGKNHKAKIEDKAKRINDILFNEKLNLFK